MLKTLAVLVSCALIVACVPSMRKDDSDDAEDWLPSVASSDNQIVAGWEPIGRAGPVEAIARDSLTTGIIGTGRGASVDVRRGGDVSAVTFGLPGSASALLWAHARPQPLNLPRGWEQALPLDRIWRTVRVAGLGVAWLVERADLRIGLLLSSIDGSATEVIETFSSVTFLEPSPDGTRLIVGGAKSRDDDVGVWVLEGGSLRQLRVGGQAFSAAWVDDTSVVVVVRDVTASEWSSRPADIDQFFDRELTSPGTVVLLNVDGGVRVLPLDLRGDAPGYLTTVSTRRTVAIAGWSGKGRKRKSALWVVDIDAGRATQIEARASPQGPDWATMTKDGSLVAYAFRSGIRVATSDGTVIADLDDDVVNNVRSFTWRGTELLYFGINQQSRRLELRGWTQTDGEKPLLERPPR